MSLPSHPSMLPRFEGPFGRRKLAEVLKRQVIVAGNDVLATKLAENASLVEASSNIVNQGDADNDIYFIISGSVAVYVNGRRITIRQAGCHIGEIALIDPTVRRSATIKALEPSILAKVSEKDFTNLAQEYPELWRNIAVELSNRLRERNINIPYPHNQPVLFIGSSAEQLGVAQAIQNGLSYDSIVVNIWTNSIFRESDTSIESLLQTINESDFAALIIGADDRIESRGINQLAPRDNVLFELGLFMGGLGRERTFIVQPRSPEIKLPSDLYGVKPFDFAEGPIDSLDSRVGPVCTKLRQVITRLGPK